MRTAVDASELPAGSEPAGSALLVDDNEATRYVLGTWLRRAGYLVDEATGGAEALAAAARGTYEIVVLDVNLPDIGGMDVCEALKADPATGSIPVLHVSATAVEAGRPTRGLPPGGDPYPGAPLPRGAVPAAGRALPRSARARRRGDAPGARRELYHAAKATASLARHARRKQCFASGSGPPLTTR